MGGGASTSSTQEQPQKDGDCLLFRAHKHAPQAVRSSPLFLEVGPVGIRVIKSEKDVLSTFRWAHIHSWVQKGVHFRMRVYDDRSRSMQGHAWTVEAPQRLMQHINHLIDRILEARREGLMAEEDFQQLRSNVADLRGELDGQLRMAQHALGRHFFTARQGAELTALLSSGFDKVELACALHARLLDQNNFHQVLAALDSTQDRTNVWHRVQSSRTKLEWSRTLQENCSGCLPAA